MRAIVDRLTGELRALERELRVELPKEIRTAVAMGDLRENAEYHAALERQTFVKARISQLRERLASLASMTLDQVPHDRAGLGSTVTLLDRDSEDEVTYELVVPELADSTKGLISIASPIGRSLVGKMIGDAFAIDVPAGRRRFEVLELLTMHDKPAAPEDGPAAE
jgi:transcription elongation factor GreA